MDHQKREASKVMKDARNVMQNLMQSAKDGDLSKLQEVIDAYRSNPKLNAASTSNEEIIEDFRDGRGRTCLHFAAASGHSRVVEFLVKLCPRAVNLSDEAGDSPLHLAVSQKQREVAEILLECGASPDASNSDMVTPLHYACGNGALDLANLLLDRGCAIEQCSKGAGAPLHWAAGEGRDDVVELLLARGADPNAKNAQALTPVLLAAAAGRRAAGCVEKLAAAGADTGLVLQGGLTVLHILADLGHAGACTAVLATPMGKKCAARPDDRGLRPAEIAADNGFGELAAALLPDAGLGSMTVEALMEAAKERERNAPPEPEDADEASKAQEFGFSVESTDPAKDQETATQAQAIKAEGNSLFVSKDYAGAIAKYTQAIELDGSDAAFWSNRSACYMETKQYQRALASAEMARQLRPDWPKACFRLAVARLALEQYEDAAMAAFEGLKLDEENDELKSLLRKCVRRGRAEHFRGQEEQGVGGGTI